MSIRWQEKKGSDTMSYRRLAPVLALMLGSCSLSATQETLTDAHGNVTYCASQAAVNSILNTTIIHACTPDNPRTVVTIVQGNSIGGAVLNTAQAAVAAIPIAIGVGVK